MPCMGGWDNRSELLSGGNCNIDMERSELFCTRLQWTLSLWALSFCICPCEKTQASKIPSQYSHLRQRPPPQQQYNRRNLLKMMAPLEASMLHSRLVPSIFASLSTNCHLVSMRVNCLKFSLCTDDKSYCYASPGVKPSPAPTTLESSLAPLCSVFSASFFRSSILFVTYSW